MITGKNVQLAANTAGTGVQAELSFQLGPDVGGSMVVVFSATGSLLLEVQISPDAPWIAFGSAVTDANDGVIALSRVFPKMRVNITANTGTCQVWIMA